MSSRFYRRAQLGLVVTALSLMGTTAAGAADGTVRSQDAKATANARNLTSEVEACWTATEDYRQCRSASVLNRGMGEFAVPIGGRRGQARVSRATRITFTIDSWSRSGTHFLMRKTAAGRLTRRCSRPGHGLCSPDGRW